MGIPFNDQSMCVEGEDREGRRGGREERRRESGGIVCRAQAVNSILSVFHLLPGLLFVSVPNALCVSGEVGFVCSPA